MTSLVVVQHCQSEHHVKGLTGGWTDTPLTELGHRQASAVAMQVKADLGGKSCRLFISDLRRALQTAKYIAKAVDIEAIPAAELREFNNGIAAGMTLEAAKRIEVPMPPEGCGIDHQPYPQAETWREFYWRVARFLDRLAADPGQDTPVLVTHGGAVVNIITWWLRLDMELLAKISFGIAAGGISWLTAGPGNERILKSLSQTAHLPADVP
jgi:broad specificity phosphatase PhoE